MKRYLALLLLFFIPLSAEESSPGFPIEEQSYNYWGEFINMMITLLFVLILIVVVVWLLKKLMRSRAHILNRTTGIKILERRPLNSKAALYLIDVFGKGIVISESPSGIHLVTELPEHAKVEELLSQLQENQSKARK